MRCLAVGLVASVFSFLPNVAAAAPKLNIPQAVYDFGSVSQGQKVTHEFAVRNDGDSDLLIQRISPACGCTAASLSASAIKPGATEKIRVTFDTTGFYGSKTKSVHVLTNVPNDPEFVLRLKGEVVRGVKVAPERIEFGEVSPSASDYSRTRELTVEPEVGQGREVAKVYSPAKSLSVTPLAEQGGLRRYKVVLAPGLAKGDLRERVIIEFKDPSHAAVNVPVVASIVGDLRVSPTMVSFGILESQQVLERRLKFQNSGTAPVKINGLSADHPALSASFIEADAVGNGVIVLKLDPSKVSGDLRSTLRVTTSHPSEGEVVIGVYGVAATAK
jgi:hypothetical protein